jgi:hypothetical protein
MDARSQINTQFCKLYTDFREASDRKAAAREFNNFYNKVVDYIQTEKYISFERDKELVQCLKVALLWKIKFDINIGPLEHDLFKKMIKDLADFKIEDAALDKLYRSIRVDVATAPSEFKDQNMNGVIFCLQTAVDLTNAIIKLRAGEASIASKLPSYSFLNATEFGIPEVFSGDVVEVQMAVRPRN